MKLRGRPTEYDLTCAKDFPSAEHDFEITCLDKSVKMVEVKSTINEFENDFYWSKNERRLFLNNPNNYIFKRVSKVFQPEAVNVRSSNNLQQLRTKTQKKPHARAPS